ncbi:MAG TPA: hypothetical protein PLK40_05840 [Bacteroidaceae bacterium]|nr:hypothetical protein [Bacteroidaceae bacterium]
MIDVTTKIHDQYSVEFKVSYRPDSPQKKHEFSLQSWYFIPNSLDINAANYGPTQFYKDVKSNIRLVIPVSTIQQLTDRQANPYKKLRTHIQAYLNQPTSAHLDKVEYHSKMLVAIAKSALRDAVAQLDDNKTQITHIERIIHDYTTYVPEMVNRVREILTTSAETSQYIAAFEELGEKNPLRLVDEYLSKVIEIYTFRVIKIATSHALSDENLLSILVHEKTYAESHQFTYAQPDTPKNNQELVARYSLLKKYVEKILYIRLQKKEDGYAISQVFFSIAAGIAMVFATIIAFAMAWRYGNASLPLFLALIVSYMLKDRIKELMRYYFAGKIHQHFYDFKAKIHIGAKRVGVIREGMLFVKDKHIPKEILTMRNRTGLLEMENVINNEKIIAYRTHVSLDNKKFKQLHSYQKAGIHDIFRLYLHRFTHKMDNPEVRLQTLDKNNHMVSIKAQRRYYIHVIMRLVYNEEVSYKHLVLVMTRKGIVEVSEHS